MLVHTCATNVVTSINHVTKSILHILYKLHFMLLPYITRQIWLPHCKYSSRYSLSILVCRPNLCKYVPKNKPTTTSTLDIISIYVPEIYTASKLNLYAIFAEYDMQNMRDVCPFLCHIWSDWHQPCEHEHRTQMITTLTRTSTLTARSDCAYWVG